MRAAKPTIPKPPISMRNATMTCPNIENEVDTSIVDKPVTVTAETEVKSASKKFRGVDVALAIGNMSNPVPAKTTMVKAIATMRVGCMSRRIFATFTVSLYAEFGTLRGL